ncbi:PPE domain-containing protein [Nocardia sp. 2]|uniref:PPE domain-containing protein n=1 Tax=Nocardia acididurans TaxID=2802282 RepID=A0ABS1M3Q4_9NOCA|nr:PPE domain-containing protein [Nocardia acididurans]MBL1075176.1 PPE domain-containing protein [Nocardia acididurans]
MVLEPTNPGFTGTVWEARPPEQLAKDLVTGAGAVPAAEAGLAWARLSAGFGSAAIDYERILETLDSAWESKNSGPFIERLRALRDWLGSAAAAAAANAVQAESHAAAYEIARLAMPDAGDVEKLQQFRELLEQVGSALGAPMLAKIALAESDADTVKAVASRVMRTYEAATEHLATPWEQQSPPPISAGLQTTENVVSAEEPVANSPQGGVPGYSMAPISIAPVKTEFRVRGNTDSTTAKTEQVVVQPVTTHQSGSAMPMAPAAMAGGQSDEEHTTREGLAGVAPTDADLGLSSGMQVAPAVLGGLDPAAQRPAVDIPFNAGTTGVEAPVSRPAPTTQEEVTG